MAYKFQLGKLTTQSDPQLNEAGEIIFTDGSLVAETGGGSDGDLVCSIINAVTTNSGPGTVTAGGELSIGGNEALILSEPAAGDFFAVATDKIKFLAAETDKGQIILKNANSRVVMDGGCAITTTEMGSATGDLPTTVGSGFLALAKDGAGGGQRNMIQMDGHNGDLACGELVIGSAELLTSQLTSSSEAKVSGDLTVHGNLVCDQAVIIDTTNTVTAQAVININDDAADSALSNGQNLGGFVVKDKSGGESDVETVDGIRVIIKFDTGVAQVSGAEKTHFAFQKSTDNFANPGNTTSTDLEAHTFYGNGSTLTITDGVIASNRFGSAINELTVADEVLRPGLNIITSTTSRTFKLPLSSNVKEGEIMRVSCMSHDAVANPHTIQRQGSDDEIDGLTSITLDAPDASIDIIKTAANKYSIL